MFFSAWIHFSLASVAVVNFNDFAEAELATFERFKFNESSKVVEDKSLQLELKFPRELAAKIVLNSLNVTNEPCDDFYDFVCGSGMPARLARIEEPRKLKLHFWKTSSSLSDYMLNHVLKRKLRELREERTNLTKRNLRKSELQIKSLLNSCLLVDTEQEQEKSSNFVKTLFYRAGFDWFREPNSGNRSSLDSLLFLATQFGITTPLISLSIRRNLTDVESRSFVFRSVPVRKTTLKTVKRDPLIMRAGKSPTERPEFETADEIVSFITDCLSKAKKSRLLGEVYDDNYRNVKRFLTNVNHAFEIGWNQTQTSNVYFDILSMHICLNRASRDWSKNFEGTISELTALTDFDWKSNLQRHLKDWTEVHDNLRVYVGEYEQVLAMLKLCTNDSTSKVVSNYLAHWLLLQLCAYLGGTIKENLCPHERHDCQDLSQTLLPLSFASLLGREILSDYDLLAVQTLTRRLILSYAKNIAVRRSWNVHFKLMITQKLEDIVVYIGYPTEYNLPNKREFDIDLGSNLLRNIFKIKRKHMFEVCRKFSNPNIFVEDQWVVSLKEPNARYYRNGNVVIIPPTVLSFPFFSGVLPQWFNLAAVGRLISHELGHAFDSKSWYTDNLGNIGNEYKEIALGHNMSGYYDCLVRKFELPIPFNTSYKYNGRLSLHENSADHSALSVMWSAFKDLKNPEKLPNTGRYTAEQMFFIVFAFISCETVTKELAAQQTKRVHALKKFRTNVNLQNSDTFAKAFDCPPDSPMTPLEEKCRY